MALHRHFPEETTNVEMALCLPFNACLDLFQLPTGLIIHGVFGDSLELASITVGMHVA